MSSPIADLSYRNYDGPLAPPLTRWWPIAQNTMRLGIKKKGFWAWSVLSAYGYFLQIIIFYFISVATPLGPDGKNPILSNVVWHDTFVTAFSISQLLLLIVAIMIGTPTIANDNRANALLVYLSRPITKFDYLFGKWLGIFIPLAAIVLVQTLSYYAYGALSLGNYGFVTKDPTLLLRLIPMCLCPAALHASLGIGISALFTQSRLAGALYAALYFISLFFTIMMQNFIRFNADASRTMINLFYCSIDGLNIGMAKLIVGTNGSSFIPQQKGSNTGLVVDRPDLTFILPVFVGLCVIGIFTAWNRIKPVEVIGG